MLQPGPALHLTGACLGAENVSTTQGETKGFFTHGCLGKPRRSGTSDVSPGMFCSLLAVSVLETA